MRIIKKLAYNAVKLATLASVGGIIAGFGPLIFAAENVNNYESIKDDLIQEYIESGEFEQDYFKLQQDLNNQHKHGIISTNEMLKEMSKFSSEEEIEKALLKSDSLLGEIYRRAVEDYEKEKKSLLTKSLAGISCVVPAYVGSAILDKMNEKKIEEEVDEDITKNNAEYAK